MNLKIIFLLLAAFYAGAQTTCPPINFLNAKTVNLDATDSSHLTLLRQSDGSYTAFEVANASPYGVLRSIPHFEQQFSNCLGRQASVTPGKAAPSTTQSSVAQPVGFAVLDSGNYLFVIPNGPYLDVTIFDPRLHFISDSQIGYLTCGAPSPLYCNYLSLVLTDVNGDGKLDVVAQYEVATQSVGTGQGGVEVLLGDGLGGFQLAGSFTLSGFINGSMAVGDLNGDGKPDIVVGLPPGSDPGGSFAGVPAGSLLLALGKGDGTFVTSTIPTPNEAGPAAIAIADLNGDGKNDLVFLTCPLTASVPFNPDEVVVMLGNGDGTFSPQAVFPVNVASPGVFYDFGPPGALAVGDVNGDGIPDIVTNGITILLGDGKGGFPARKDFLNTNEDAVILTDFDGDGKMDVLIGAGNPLALSQATSVFGISEITLTVFFGDGTGGLIAAPLAFSPTPASQRPVSGDFFPRFLELPAPVVMTSGDFNKDGIADIAFVSEFQYLSVFLGNVSGAITPTFTYDFAAADQQAYPTSVAAGDFNHDGILDLAVTVARPSSDGSVMVFLGKGDGTFLPPISSNAPGAIWSLAVGDFNKDGQADLAAINTATDFQADQVVVFLGQGDGTFASAKTYATGIGATSLAVGDFNQDGFADIAIADLGSFTGAGINLLLGKGDGTFSQGAYIAFPEGGGPQSVAAADLNGDGKLDLVAGVQSQGAAILFGNGDGTFLSPITYPANVASVAVGDINGDGIPDVVLSSASVLIGRGDGTFQLQTLDLPLFTGPLIAADFNGDGKLDVASGYAGEGAAIFLNLSHPTALLNVVSAADFSQGPVAPHSIASAFGKHLALSTASATPPALPTTLGGATVSVQDQTGAVGQAEIYYASPGQVNFVLPPGLETGAGIVTIRTADGQSASTEIQIAPVAPTLFILEPSGIPVGYAVQVSADNVQTIEPIFTEQGGIVQEVPIDVSTGDVYLVLFGTGFDTTSFGAEVEIGDVDESASYVGPQNQFPGLDQINFLVPKSLAGRGSTSVLLSFVTSEVNFYITIK